MTKSVVEIDEPYLSFNNCQNIVKTPFIPVSFPQNPILLQNLCVSKIYT